MSKLTSVKVLALIAVVITAVTYAGWSYAKSGVNMAMDCHKMKGHQGHHMMMGKDSPCPMKGHHNKVAVNKSKKTDAKQTDKTKDIYTCPMHPEVTSDKPGTCPECNMFLEKKEK